MSQSILQRWFWQPPPAQVLPDHLQEQMQRLELRLDHTAAAIRQLADTQASLQEANGMDPTPVRAPEPWRWDAAPSEPGWAHVDDRLVDLERKFESVRAAASVGPLPGALVTVPISKAAVNPVNIANEEAAGLVLPAHELVAFGCLTLSGDLTIRLTVDGTTIVSSLSLSTLSGFSWRYGYVDSEDAFAATNFAGLNVYKIDVLSQDTGASFGLKGIAWIRVLGDLG